MYFNYLYFNYFTTLSTYEPFATELAFKSIPQFPQDLWDSRNNVPL